MQSTDFPRPKARKTLKVETPEWEDSVYVAKLGGEQMQHIEDLRKLLDKPGDPAANGHMGEVRFMLEVAVVFMCDKTGASVLTADDVPRLLKEEFAPFQRVFDAGCEFNNMTDDSAERVRKNSPATSGGKHG